MSDKCAGCGKSTEGGKSTEDCNCFATKAAPEQYHYISWAELKAENERLKRGIAEANNVIVELRSVLPDSHHLDDECWDWGWDELDGDAQDLVKEKRELSLVWLKEYAKETK
jgi:hypothetical protein